jgi:hypothetical protein
MIVIDVGAARAGSAMSVFFRVGVSVVAALTVGAVIVSLPRPAAAKPEFAAKTGLPCANCHVSPTGGGKLKPFGEKYKANGFNIK